MHVLFEVLLSPGSLGHGLLTEETMRDTQAQVMSKEEAEGVGFAGLPDDGQARCYIICAERDAGRIRNALTASNQVAAFDMHPVDM
jgi:hypothetical protein